MTARQAGAVPARARAALQPCRPLPACRRAVWALLSWGRQPQGACTLPWHARHCRLRSAPSVSRRGVAPCYCCAAGGRDLCLARGIRGGARRGGQCRWGQAGLGSAAASLGPPARPTCAWSRVCQPMRRPPPASRCCTCPPAPRLPDRYYRLMAMNRDTTPADAERAAAAFRAVALTWMARNQVGATPRGGGWRVRVGGSSRKPRHRLEAMQAGRRCLRPSPDRTLVHLLRTCRQAPPSGAASRVLSRQPAGTHVRSTCQAYRADAACALPPHPPHPHHRPLHPTSPHP